MKCRLLLTAGVLALLGCGQTSPEKGKNLASGELPAQAKSDVPRALEKMVGHEICSGKVTEEWVNPTSGEKVRQIWERKARFVDFKNPSEGFSVGYKVLVSAQYFKPGQDGTWLPSDKQTFNSTVVFYGVWSEALGRYVGHALWQEQARDGKPVAVEFKSPLKVTSYTASGDTVTMNYLESLPLPATENSPTHLNVYEETLSLNSGKLERNWSYKNYSYDPVTLNPTSDLQVGAKPSFDTEEKCSL